MKKQLLILACLVFTTLSLYAQAPEKLNYQGIARSTNGLPMQNRNLGLRISILDGATAVYVETNNVSTNGFGLYKLAIGAGIPVSGSMGTVDWSSGNKFIKVEIDPQGGTNYSSLGTNELLSVPYALYAASSGSTGNGSPSGAAGGDLTGTYPNPEIANNAILSNHIKDGEVKTVDLANNAVTTTKIANDAITSAKVADGAIGTSKLDDGVVTSPKIAAMGATNGQVLKFDGTNWVPGADNEGPVGTTYTAGDGIGISGTNEITSVLGTDISTNELQNSAVTTPKIADGAITSGKINQMNAVNGQVLQWNGAEWIPANAGGGGGDDWGTQVTQTADRLSGNGTGANPLDIAQQGAVNGQVLKWNGATWEPADDEVGAGGAGDDWGTQIVQSDATLDGEGTIAFPLGLANAAVTGEKINQMGAANGQVLKWNGATWEPANDIGGGAGDDWGIQIVETDATLDGDGTAVNPLGIADGGVTANKLATGAVTGEKIEQMGAANGQVLKWNGATWEPANDIGGGAGDDWGTQVVETNATLTGDGTIGNELSLAQNGATDGQILTWDDVNNNWIPSNQTPGGDGLFIADADNILYSDTDNFDKDFLLNTSQIDYDNSLIREAKMLFLPSQYGAFRVGVVDQQSWNLNNIGMGSVAFGVNTEASDYYATAMGSETTASGRASTAMGLQTWATGAYSTAMGYWSSAGGLKSTAMGISSAAMGEGSTAMGKETEALGDFSTAMGNQSSASGIGSTSMGFESTASGDNSLAGGTGSIASEINAIAIGWENEATNMHAVALGAQTKATNHSATALGNNTKATGPSSTSMGSSTEASGDYSTSMGRLTIASGWASTAMGYKSTALTGYSTSMGWEAEASGTTATAIGRQTKASGENSTAMGRLSEASGETSTAIGFRAKASGVNSTAMGEWTEAIGKGATAMGKETKASGEYSTALGFQTKASGVRSTSMGSTTEASGWASTAMGGGTKAIGNYSTTMGQFTEASGDRSIAIGHNATAKADNSTVIGMNVELTPTATGSMFLGGTDTAAHGVWQKSASNRFYASFGGGYYLYTNSYRNSSQGVSLPAMGNSWVSNSDINLKENIEIVEGNYFIESIKKMELGSWNYIGQDAEKYRHWGPMAQDFHKYFGHDGIGKIGTDTTIATADIDGVMMIAIQQLARENDSLKSKIADLKQIVENQKELANAQQFEFDDQSIQFKKATSEMEERLSRIEAMLKPTEQEKEYAKN